MGSERKEFLRLQKLDRENAAKKNPTTLAEDFKVKLRQDYIDEFEGRKPAQSGAAPSNAPKGAKLIGTSNGKPVYQLPDGTQVIQE